MTSFWSGIFPGRRRESAARDLYHAERDQNFYGANGPDFFVETAPDVELSLDDLVRLREQPSMLLSARRQVIPFTGRAAELNVLQSWRDSNEQYGAFMLHAPGGQGKTRLASYAAEQAKAAEWAVAFARYRDETPLGGQPLGESKRSLLLVVDYADRWPQTSLHSLFRAYAGSTERLRILLLARSNTWWPTINAELDGLGFIAGDPLPLAELASTTSKRQEIFDVAVSRFGEIYQLADVPALSPAGHLSEPVYGLALALHMAALAAVDAHASQLEPPGRSADLSRYLLNRERRYWAKLHGDDGVSTAARCVFIAAMAGPQTLATATPLMQRCGLPDAAAATSQQLIDAHARCYPSADNDYVLEPLYPDRVAEDFIALTLADHQLSGHADNWSANLVTIAHDNRGSVHHTPGALFDRDKQRRVAPHVGRSLIFLGAAASRWPHVVERLRALLNADPGLAVEAGGAALVAVTPHTDLSLAESIFWHMPQQGTDVNSAVATFMKHLVQISPPDAPADRQAFNLSMLSTWMGYAGRLNEGLDAAERAVEIYRSLLASLNDPLRRRSTERELADALSVLGIIRSRLKIEERPPSSADEAHGIYLRLDGVESEGVARSLHTRGMDFVRQGRHHEAIGPLTEAHAIFLSIVDGGNSPRSYRPELAQAATNLGDALFEVGQMGTAIGLIENAVTIRRELARKSPDDHLPRLTVSLVSLGRCLLKTGDTRRAIGLIEEAVAIRRRLARDNPDNYLPSLAYSLRDLAYAYRDIGRIDEAVSALEEGTTILSRFTGADPNV